MRPPYVYRASIFSSYGCQNHSHGVDGSSEAGVMIKISRQDSFSSERSLKAKNNILASFANKGIAIAIAFLLVPITINYLTAEQYGIWLTLSSIVGWISYFDIGFGHGFRNRFAEAKAKGDTLLARKYVSTTYCTLFILFGCIILIVEILNSYIRWDNLLNVTVSNALIQDVVSILVFGVCIGFILNVATIMLSADQRPAASAMISTMGQGCALIAIYILSVTTEGNMRYIAFALSYLPCIVVLFVSFYLFSRPYRAFSPSIACIDYSLIKNIIGLGSKFFVIQISMLLIFQMVNIILSRTLGPESVTQYNVAYKYFSVTQMVFNIILSPFWSAFTEAYVKRDYDWMVQIRQKLVRVWRILLVVNVVLLIASPLVFDLWIGDLVHVPWSVSVSMMLYVSVLSYSNMYMILLNGIGKVFLQMIIYVICACFSIPFCYYLCDRFGIPGILAILSGVYLIQAIFARIQLNSLLAGNCTGIMNR